MKHFTYYAKAGLIGVGFSAVLVFLSPILGKVPALQKTLLAPYFYTIIFRCGLDSSFSDMTICMSSWIEIIAVVALVISYLLLGLLVGWIIQIIKASSS